MNGIRTIIIVIALALFPMSAFGATLRVGSTSPYPPLDFRDKFNRHTGFDYDLAGTLAKQLGMQLDFQDRRLDNLIGELNSGQFDLLIAAMNDNKERSAQVDFVDYFLTGAALLVPASNPHHLFNLGGLCGLTVDSDPSSVFFAKLQLQSKNCVAVGLRPITIPIRRGPAEMIGDLAAGKSAAFVCDYPVAVYLSRAAARNGKKYVIAGKQFDATPYGIAVSKKNAALRVRVQAALKVLIADGTYDRLLQKWGLEQGALRGAPINAGMKFESLVRRSTLQLTPEDSRSSGNPGSKR